MVIRTRTAHVSLVDGWCVAIRVERDMVQSLADARENIAATIVVSGSKKRPLFVDISTCGPLEPEARHYYSGEVLDAFTAQALLVEPTPVGRAMFDVYVRVAKPSIPTRVFQREDEALAWLRGAAP